MHTSVLGSDEFELTIDGEPADIETLFEALGMLAAIKASELPNSRVNVHAVPGSALEPPG